MSTSDEQQLIRRALTGEQRAYRSLYQRNLARITAIVAQRATHPDDIDDLVQLTFTRAFVSLSGFRRESSFSTWLTRIAINVCSSHYQSRRLWLHTDAFDQSPAATLPSKEQTPEESLIRKETTEAVRRSIGSLPDRYREAMQLRYVEDRSYPEVVGALDVPLGTVKTWLYRGRQLVREDLEGPDAM